MISPQDREQRRVMRAIATGCPAEHPSVKTEAYGHFIALFGKISLDPVKQDLDGTTPKSIDELIRMTSRSLADCLHPQLWRWPQHMRINGLFNEVGAALGDSASPAAALGRLDNGIAVGTYALGLVLPTVRYDTVRGANTISRSGLHASKRVSIALAEKLGGTPPNGDPDHGFSEVPVVVLNESEAGPVLRSSMYTFDPDRGLDLVAAPVYYPRYEGDWHLGCPFTPRIAELHAILADVAIRSELIPVAD